MTQIAGGSDNMIETLNYGSHLPARMACTAVCEGPVLEIGCGNFSTPCLHSLCAVLKLPLVTTELEDSWREQFTSYASPTHQVLKQSVPLLAELAKQKWGLVFIDDQPDTRLGWLNVFFESARFVLQHDSNFPQYDQVLKDWVAARQCYHRTYTRVGPWTLAVSKTHPIPEFD
jgi:hypothetical protein